MIVLDIITRIIASIIAFICEIIIIGDLYTNEINLKTFLNHSLIFTIIGFIIVLYIIGIVNCVKYIYRRQQYE